jgi:hypothetical protein
MLTIRLGLILYRDIYMDDFLLSVIHRDRVHLREGPPAPRQGCLASRLAVSPGSSVRVSIEDISIGFIRTGLHSIRMSYPISWEDTSTVHQI